jgi:hypothetical protein
MGKRYLGWVFYPENWQHIAWVAPDNYIRAAVGEIRIKLESDTPMTDWIFEPGWRRCPSLDCTMS